MPKPKNKTGLTVYITTYDASAFMIKPAAHLFNKYWGAWQPVRLLGYSKPKHKLPDNFEFISMGKDPKHADLWTRKIHDTVKKVADNEFLVHLLDDHLASDYLNLEIFNDLLGRMKADKTVLRCALGFGPSQRTYSYKTIDSKNNYDVYELNQDAEYRVAGQCTLWRTDYFLKCMDNDWNAWKFELLNSEKAKNDGNKVLGTAKNYTFRWLEHSALSGRSPKGKINILGLRFEDIKYLLDKKFFKPEELQYGVGEVPDFKDVGYDFKIEDLKPYKSPKEYWDLYYEHAWAYE